MTQENRGHWLNTRDHAEWFLMTMSKSSLKLSNDMRTKYVSLLHLAEQALEAESDQGQYEVFDHSEAEVAETAPHAKYVVKR